MLLERLVTSVENNMLEMVVVVAAACLLLQRARTCCPRLEKSLRILATACRDCAVWLRAVADWATLERIRLCRRRPRCDCDFVFDRYLPTQFGAAES